MSLAGMAMIERARGWKFTLAWFVFVLTLLLVGGAAADAKLPTLQSRVTDQASILSGGARRDLESRLAAYEQATGHQFAFVSITSLDGDPIEDFSMRLAEKWKLGDEKRDDGLLLIVAKDDRKMRIEVGYGLEGAIPDALAAQIIRNQLTPAFRANDFDGGVAAAFGTLMKAAEGEAVQVGDPKQTGKNGKSKSSPLTMLVWGLILLVMVSTRGGRWLLVAMLFSGRGRSSGGFGGGGGFSGGGGGFGGGGASGGW